MELSKEQIMAYTEVVEVLKYMSKEDVNKIPKDIVRYYTDNRDTSYNFKIDMEKAFEQQNLSEKAKIVLAMLYRDYWSTEKQKEKIKQKEKYDLYKLELKKQEKYNSDNIFENRKIKRIEENKALVEHKKETLCNKFIQFIRRFFKKSK